VRRCHSFVFVELLSNIALAINGWELNCPTKIDVRNPTCLTGSMTVLL
jgi:hypothetical protein